MNRVLALLFGALTFFSSWAQGSQSPVQIVTLPDSFPISSLHHAPETGDVAVLQSKDNRGFVQVWNATGREKWNFSVPQNSVYSMSFGRRGKILAVGGVATEAWMRQRRSEVTNQGTVRVLDARNGQVLRQLQCAPRGYVHSLAVAPDAPLLAVAGHSWIELWNYSTAKRVTTFRTQGEVTSLSFSPDGRFLASAQLWKPPTIWNLKTRKIAFEMPRETNSAQTFVVGFSPRSDFLASAGFSFLALHGISDRKLKWKVEQDVGIGPSYYAQNSNIDFSIDGKLLSLSGENTQIFAASNGATHALWKNFLALRFGNKYIWSIKLNRRVGQPDSYLPATLFKTPIKDAATPPERPRQSQKRDFLPITARFKGNGQYDLQRLEVGCSQNSRKAASFD